MIELKPVNGVSIHPTARIAKNASLLNDVRIGADVSIWPGVVARGDHHEIVIGDGSNVQDNAIIHESHDSSTVIGENVTIGHGAIIHGCTIGDNCIIGMGSVIMDNAVIGENCLIGAGAVVSKNVNIPANSVVMGLPGKVRREMTAEEIAYNAYSAKEYQECSRTMVDEGVFWWGKDVPEDLPLIRLKRD